MRQSDKSDNKNIKGTDDAASPIGAMSVTALLKELSTNKDSLNFKLTPFIEKLPSVIDLFLNLSDTFNKQQEYIKNISLNIQSIVDLISRYFPEAEKPVAAVTSQQSNIGDKLSQMFNKGYNFVMKDTLSEAANKSISEINSNILLVINNQEKIIELLSKADKPKIDNDNNASDFNNKFFGNLIKAIKKDLNQKTLDNFTKFLDIYLTFIDNNNTKKLIAVATQLQTFAVFLRILGFQLHKTKSYFNGLTTAIVLLTLALVLPPFQIGFGFLLMYIRALSFAVGGKEGLNLFRNLSDVGKGIIMLVVGTYLMSKVNFGNVFKLILALSMLAGVLKLFQKKSSTKVPKTFSQQAGKGAGFLGMTGGISMLILSVAFGLIMIVLACTLASVIDWSATTQLLMFMGGLAVALILIKRIGGENKAEGLFGFSLGVAILLLCVDSATEVDWIQGFKIVLFIFGIAMALGLAKRITGGGKFSGIFGFSMGIAILLLCIDATSELEWDNAWNIIKFVLAISLAIRVAGKGGKGFIRFAFSVGLLLLVIDAASEVNFDNAWKLLGFVLGLSFVLRVSSKLLKINVGLLVGLLSGAIIAFIYAVTFRLIPDNTISNIWSILGCMVGVIMVMKLANTLLGTNLKITSLITGIIVFAVFSWIFALTDDSINVLKVANIVIVIGLIYAFIYAIHLQNKLLGTKIKVTQILTTIVVGAIEGFIFSFWMTSFVSLDFQKVTMLILAVVSFVGVLWLISKFEKPIVKASTLLTVGGMLIAVAGLVALSVLVSLNMAPGAFSIAGVIMLGITTGIFIAILWLVSKMKKDILVGAGIVVIISFSLGILAGAMTVFGLFSPLIIAGGAALVITAITFAGFVAVAVLCSFFAVPILIGAGVIFAVSVTLILVAVAMAAIAAIQINEEQISLFVKSLGIIAIGLFTILPQLILGAVAAVFGVAVGIASIIIAAALFVISELVIKEERIKAFGNGIIKLTEAYDSCGLWAITKAVAKSLLLVPIAITTLLVALALKAISLLDINVGKIDKFGIILEKFIDTMVTVVDKYSGKIKDNRKAFQIIADMANAAGSIVNIIDAMVNMTVGVWDTDKKTGEAKMISKRQVKDEDFALVSRNIGKMMEALVAPLSIIASDDEYWDFDGKKVKNPFNKVNGFFGPKDNMSGVNRIKAIGDAFEKIPAIMQGFVNNPLLTDLSDEGKKKFELLQTNIATFFDTIVLCMDKLGNKSELDAFFDGTASWLKDTVAPVFKESCNIMYTLRKSLFWSTSNLHVLYPRVIGFWSMTSDVASIVEKTKDKNINAKFASKFVDFYSELEKLKNNQWLASDNMQSTVVIASSTKELINSLSDSSAFNRITKNLQNTNKNVKEIVTNINKINISKAAALERNLKLLTQAKSQDALRIAIEELKEMIGLLKEAQENQTSAIDTQTTQFGQFFFKTQETQDNEKLTSTERESRILDVLQRLNTLLESNGIMVDLTGVSDEIEQALQNCGIGNHNNVLKRGYIPNR